MVRERFKRFIHCWFVHFIYTMADCYDGKGHWLGAICACGKRFGDKTLVRP